MHCVLFYVLRILLCGISVLFSCRMVNFLWKKYNWRWLRHFSVMSFAFTMCSRIKNVSLLFSSWLFVPDKYNTEDSWSVSSHCTLKHTSVQHTEGFLPGFRFFIRNKKAVSGFWQSTLDLHTVNFDSMKVILVMGIKSNYTFRREIFPLSASPPSFYLAMSFVQRIGAFSMVCFCLS